MSNKAHLIRESFIDVLVPLIPLLVIWWVSYREGITWDQKSNLILGAGALFVVLWIARKWQLAARRRRDAERAQRIVELCRTHAQGVYKRIDENRELLELLQHEAPELLDRCFSIEGWMRSQDDFLQKLAHEVFGSVTQRGDETYPRPWPGKTPKKG